MLSLHRLTSQAYCLLAVLQLTAILWLLTTHSSSLGILLTYIDAAKTWTYRKHIM
jgi:hypothetical protein